VTEQFTKLGRKHRRTLQPTLGLPQKCTCLSSTRPFLSFSERANSTCAEAWVDNTIAIGLVPPNHYNYYLKLPTIAHPIRAHLSPAHLRHSQSVRLYHFPKVTSQWWTGSSTQPLRLAYRRPSSHNARSHRTNRSPCPSSLGTCSRLGQS
jgi:hypothetical protein